MQDANELFKTIMTLSEKHGFWKVIAAAALLIIVWRVPELIIAVQS